MANAVKSSDKTFGIFFAFIFALISLLFFAQGYLSISLFASFIAFILASVSLIIPEKLSKLNHAWSRLSTLISKITSPVIMGIIFVTLFIPISLLGRLRGRDELRLKVKPGRSYWEDVSSEYSENFSFHNQY